MAIVPWINGLSVHYKADDKLEFNKFPHVQAWVKRILERPKTKIGMSVCSI